MLFIKNKVVSLFWITQRRLPFHGNYVFSEKPFLLQSFFLRTAPPVHICFLCALVPFSHCYFCTFSQSYLPSQDSLTSFSWGFPSLFIAQTLSRRIQTQCQIPDCPDWKGLCWIMQSILELRLSGVPKKPSNCILPSGRNHKEPPWNWSLSRSQMASGRDVVQVGRLSQ